jgi:hypothetical protein
MCGRFVMCCSIASRRGSNLMPYKELVGATSVRQGMSGALAISYQGGKRSKQTGFEG